jgi:hypothetical protein
MSLLIVFLVYAVAMIVEIPGLVKNPRKNILLPYAVLMGMAVTIQVLFELKIKLPSPLQPITYLISDVLKLK